MAECEHGSPAVTIDGVKVCPICRIAELEQELELRFDRKLKNQRVQAEKDTLYDEREALRRWYRKAVAWMGDALVYLQDLPHAHSCLVEGEALHQEQPIPSGQRVLRMVPRG